MKTSTRALRRLVRNLGLALAVAAVAAPVAQAKSDDYGIESFRVPANIAVAYEAIESHRVTRPPETGSLAYELSRAARETATQHRYDGIELVRSRPSQPATRLPYDDIELVRAPSDASSRLRYDGIELVRSGARADVAPRAVVSADAFDWSDAGTGALFGLVIGLLAASAGLVIGRRSAGFAAS